MPHVEYPWAMSQIQLPPIGLRETVARVAFMRPRECEFVAVRSAVPLLRTVARWRIEGSPQWETLKGLICPDL